MRRFGRRVEILDTLFMSTSRFSLRKAIDGAIIAGLLTCVVFTTLAFGTVDAWSVAIFQLIVVVLVLLCAVKAIVEKRLELRIPKAAVPLAGFVLMGFAQSVAITGASGETTSLSMDVEARFPRRSMSRETEDDVDRVRAIWTECRARASARGG